MRQRNRTLQAWLLFAATLACLLGGLVVTLFVTRPLTREVLVDGAFEGSFWLLFATIGLVLTLRRPANPIGWLYAAAGLVWSASIPVDPWLDQLQRSGWPLPLSAQYLALIGETFWAVGLTLAITLPLLLLPDGRLRSPRWRPVLVAAVAGTAVEVVGWCLDPAPMTNTLEPMAKPFALHGSAGTVASVVGWTGWGILFACVPAAALCAVLRFRASHGVERQQLRWVAFGAAASVVGPVAAIALKAVGVLPNEDAFSWPLLLSVPLAIAVAVLRYRLWEPGRRRALPAPASPGPGPGRPPLQPPPLRRRPHRGRVRGPAARPGGPGRPPRRAAGRGPADHAAHPGVAVAARARDRAVGAYLTVPRA